MAAALKVQNLTKELGKRIILDNIDFEVKEGEIFGIIGMSGSGKTTLLNHLIGFYEPDEGTIFYQSNTKLQDLKKHGTEVKRTFGFSPQTPSFYPKLTVEENLLHFAALHQVKGDDFKSNMNNLLELTKLKEHKDKLAEYLSGGMQRRLSIICGLIHKPKVLILDEPTADLDPVLREEAWSLIQSINKLGTTIVVASHFLEELEVVCDRVAIIHESKMISYGTIEEIKDRYGEKTVEIQVQTDKKYFPLIIANINRANVMKVNDGKDILTLYTQKPKDTLYELAQLLRNQTIQAYGLEVHRPTLKEVFESISLKK
jgi:ABC-2 type transport system ATP-binding protein